MLEIDAISDTHGHHAHYTMPGGDILICSGDVSGRGLPQAIMAFLDWFQGQDYRYKVWIPGNHDFDCERNPALWKEESGKRGVIMLNDSGCEVDGIKIWGSPITPWFHNWAFNRWPAEIQKHWDLIPKDTEILVTHGPPFNILDGCFTPPTYDDHVGCHKLLETIKTLTKLKLHIFGHIHEARGHKKQGKVLYVNASSLDQFYKCIQGVPYRIQRDDKGKYKIAR